MNHAQFIPQDPEILTTVGEDGMMFLFDSSGYPVHSAETSTNVFQIAWNPNVSGIVATAGRDETVSISSLHNMGPHHVPKWLKSHSGVSCGFGGQFVSFSSQQPSTITMAKLPVDDESANYDDAGNFLYNDPLDLCSTMVRSFLNLR